MLPLLAAAASPIIQSLMQNGLTTLASAVSVKGKEVIENTLGVKIDTSTPQQVLALKQLEFDHEERLRGYALEESKMSLKADLAASEAITRRWEADLHSDSFLAKNIRPMVLIYILVSYTLLSLLSAFGFNVTESYVALLGQWGMLVMSAYFVGRSVEKVLKGDKP